MATTPNPVIDVTKLTKERTAAPAEKPEKSKLLFGHTFTDHMLEVDWTAEAGWGVPRITPRHNLSLDPAASVLHYAIEVFEGLLLLLLFQTSRTPVTTILTGVGEKTQG